MAEQVTVKSQEWLKAHTFGAQLEGTPAPSGTGELVAINPTVEQFVTYHENFRLAHKAGHVDEFIVDGSVQLVVYNDTGSDRIYCIEPHEVEIGGIQ
jgi:hypothetical protein